MSMSENKTTNESQPPPNYPARPTLKVTPKYYAHAYFTPGVHKKPQWTAYIEYQYSFRFGTDYDEKLRKTGTETCVVVSEDRYLCRVYAEGNYNTAEEAINAAKKIPVMAIECVNNHPEN